MTGDPSIHSWPLQDYIPRAIYYEEADSLEYVREDVPAVYRRIDELLTLVLSMDNRTVIGLQIKGFRNFYLRHLKDKYQLKDDQFPRLVSVIEDALSIVGNSALAEQGRREAYEEALNIAEEDRVELREFPDAA